MKFEEKLMTLRKRAGMSQEELADRLGVSRQAVSRWELGSTLPDAPNLLKLSDLFGVSIDSLLRENGVAEPEVPQEEVVDCGMPEKKRKNRKLNLVAGAAFALAAFAFLVAAIDLMDIQLVLMSLADSALAAVFLWKYLKT